MVSYIITHMSVFLLIWTSVLCEKNGWRQTAEDTKKTVYEKKKKKLLRKLFQKKSV